MKFSINYTQLGAEFVIVVIGVAVALAADGWRQELSERGLEAEYLERLIAEVEIGKDRFILDREFLTDASEGLPSFWPLSKLKLTSTEKKP